MRVPGREPRLGHMRGRDVVKEDGLDGRAVERHSRWAGQKRRERCVGRPEDLPSPGKSRREKSGPTTTRLKEKDQELAYSVVALLQLGGEAGIPAEDGGEGGKSGAVKRRHQALSVVGGCGILGGCYRQQRSHSQRGRSELHSCISLCK